MKKECYVCNSCGLEFETNSNDVAGILVCNDGQDIKSVDAYRAINVHICKCCATIAYNFFHREVKE